MRIFFSAIDSVEQIEGTCDTAGHSGDNHPKTAECVYFMPFDRPVRRQVVEHFELLSTGEVVPVLTLPPADAPFPHVYFTVTKKTDVHFFPGSVVPFGYIPLKNNGLSPTSGVCVYLNTLLDAARKHTMTPEEKESQRQSWVRGEMGIGTDADEARARGLTLQVGDNCVRRRDA